MVKRIVLGSLLIGLIGVLVAGGIIRTVDRTEKVAEARGQGRGQGSSEVGEYASGQQGEGRGGNSQGGGYGQSGEVAERQYVNYEEPVGDLLAYEGTVVEAAESGGDLVIMTDDGQEIKVGTGPGYMEAQGFTLEAGEQVQVQGYWEDDELKAAQVTRLRDGQTLVLRDQFGRPAWAGSGKQATEQQAVTSQAVISEGGRGQGGQGQAGRGQSNQGQGGSGGADVPADGAGAGQAQVDAWVALHGSVVGIDANALVVQTESGEQVMVEGRPWWFAQEQGFMAQVGDELAVVGFYENGEFEAGRLDNLSIGLSVPIREEGGRPLWAGGGRRGG